MAQATAVSPQALLKAAKALVEMYNAKDWDRARAAITADFVYVRLHGDVELYKSGYTDEALERWAARVRAWRDGRKPPAATFVAPAPRLRPRDVYVYFDNDVKVHAPYDAMNLAAKVEGTSHEESRLESKAQPRPLPRQTRLRANA